MQQLQILMGIVIITLILGALVILFIAALNSIQQRKKAELHYLNILAEVAAQEKEKAGLTDKLHEEFGATLSVVKMNINSLELTHPEDELKIEKSTRYLDDVITKIRGIAANYLPYMLQRKQLVRALETLAVSTSENNKDIAVSFKAGEDIPDISEHKTLHLYRIVQEIVHNTIKHAQATQLSITLTKEDHQLLLVSKDNGIGFDYSTELQKQKGVGLKNIHNRVSLLKGTINVISQIQKGTAYMIAVPL